MQMTGQQIYDAFLHGAYTVIEKKDILNKINVFPIQDGDTGNNLSSMMQTIIQTAKSHSNVKQTLESISDAAFVGARGNSGIIFASYFRGLSDTVAITEGISIDQYAAASKCAAQYAYEAVEHPVEGTMLTLMRDWGEILSTEIEHNQSIPDILTRAFHRLEHALETTKEQLAILKKANVVDSGAKGFTYFIEGILRYLKQQDDIDFHALLAENKYDFIPNIPINSHIGQDGFRYCSECLLSELSLPANQIKNDLKQFGNSIVVAKSTTKCRVHIHTNEPAKVFSYLGNLGSILYQKVDDMQNQEAIVNHRKYNIALVTDSIADVPKAFLDEHQIQILHLDILYHGMNYFDKLTIEPSSLLDMIANDPVLPTSSQPSPGRITQFLDYLSTYYDSILVLCVSKELSGTYNSFLRAVDHISHKNVKIQIINTRQNSGAQGLLVKKGIEYLAAGNTYEQIVKNIQTDISRTKILVQVKTLDSMIKSGRLTLHAGTFAKKIGMRPIVTLDQKGKGKLQSIAFSEKGSLRKIKQHIKKVQQTFGIEQYNIVHVNNCHGAEELAKQMTLLLGFAPEYIMETSSIIALNAGDKAVAISYIHKKGQ